MNIEKNIKNKEFQTVFEKYSFQQLNAKGMNNLNYVLYINILSIRGKFSPICNTGTCYRMIDDYL